MSETSVSFGGRLDYYNSKCNDIWAAILFYCTIIAFVVSTVYFYITEKDNFDEITTETRLNLDDAKIFGVCMAASSGVAILLALLCLKIIQCCPGIIIRFMLIINLLLWIVVLIGGYLQFGSLGVIPGVVGFVLFGIYTCCIWSKIAFTNVLLRIASEIIISYYGTTCLAFITIFMSIIWLILWVSCVAGYLLFLNGERVNGYIIGAFIFALFWGFEVLTNCVHSTQSGVTAAWYFNINRHNTTFKAYKRTMTTSFGSVCFGSIFVSIVAVLRAILSDLREINCCSCIITCLDGITRYVNVYGFAFSAIYGTKYIESCKNVFDMFTLNGIYSIINDELTGIAVISGSFLTFIISGITAFLVCCYIMGIELINADEYVIFVAIIGAIIGCFICYQILYLIRSSIICLFACYSEDPSILRADNESYYNALIIAKPEMSVVTGIDESRQPFV